MEIVVGLLLVLGLATRAAAFVGLGQALFLALVYASGTAGHSSSRTSTSRW